MKIAQVNRTTLPKELNLEENRTVVRIMIIIDKNNRVNKY